MKTSTPSHLRLVAIIALGALSLAGCSTPATRIQADPATYERLTPQQQELVRAGQIALGFDYDAVKLALGDPDRVTTRMESDRERVVWHYLSYESEGRILFTGYYHTRRGWWGGWAYPYYLDYPSRRVRDRFRVEFVGGRVVAISEERIN